MLQLSLLHDLNDSFISEDDSTVDNVDDSILVLKKVWKNKSMKHSNTFENINFIKNVTTMDVDNIKQYLDDDDELKLINPLKKDLNYTDTSFNEQYGEMISNDSSIVDLGIVDHNNLNINNNTNTNNTPLYRYKNPIKDINVSPAREKMLLKFEEQKERMQLNKRLKELQFNSLMNIHNAAPIKDYPLIDHNDNNNNNNDNIHIQSDDIIDNVSIHTPTPDSTLFETYQPSPTKIPVDYSNHVFDKPVEFKNKFNDNLFSDDLYKNESVKKTIPDNPFIEQLSDSAPLITEVTESVSPPLQQQQPQIVSRLFIRLLNINSISLPLESRNAKIQLTFDNGIHCIKTDFFDVNNPIIPIDKEFECIVSSNLQLIITFKIKFDKLPMEKVITTKKVLIKQQQEKPKSNSKSFFKKFNNKEKKNKNKNEKPLEQYKTVETVTEKHPIDPLHDYISPDGSFSKLKINFNEYKDRVSFHPTTFSLTCYNEWKNTKINKSKIENSNPIPICNLNLKMLYIESSITKNKQDTLPISINNAINQLIEFRKLTKTFQFESFMNQLGGDVNTITRRYYKLQNNELFAYIDNKLKAKINLRKVIKLVIEPYDGLSNGFKIIFHNGENIEFSCDNIELMNKWVDCFNGVINFNKISNKDWLLKLDDSMKDVVL